MKALWILVILGVVAGTFQFIGVLSSTSVSAPQQAAGGAMAVAYAILPYCFVRAIQFMVESPSERELKRLNESLATHTRLLAALANASPNEAPNAEADTAPDASLPTNSERNQ
jgi:hypothetical protein